MMRRSTRAANRGLTLMEILVVLVIIAVVAGFAVLSTVSLGGDTPQERTARRVAALIQLASENAVMGSKQYGIEIQPHGYRFFIYNGTSWQPITKDQTFHPRHLDSSIVLTLQLEGRPITLPQPVTAMPAAEGAPAPATSALAQGSDNGTQATTGPHPQILALSSGELTAFDLEISDVGHKTSYHVRGHMNGKIQLIPPKTRVLNR
ncbi:MAG TPA: type II secretion system minor pseudopilin GspH [Gammaproteobacteria bacterium]|nr:type II secretion system minor pseudopilin GspH [Gammaproteobacteria bacterium]